MQHQFHRETLVDLCSFYTLNNNVDASEYTQYRKRAKNKKIYPLRQQKNCENCDAVLWSSARSIFDWFRLLFCKKA